LPATIPWLASRKRLRRQKMSSDFLIYVVVLAVVIGISAAVYAATRK
jgi:hypothetical protein